MRYAESMSTPTPKTRAKKQSAAAYLVSLARKIEVEAPAEQLKRLPRDGAKNHNHYLYGAPKIK
jgi:hypothetical protein